MDQFTGGSLCGDVRLVATGGPYRVGICHCLDCRKHHGALFFAAAIFPQDAVTVAGLQGPPFLLALRLVGVRPGGRRGRGAPRRPGRARPADRTYENWTVRRETWLPPFDLTHHYPHDRETTGRDDD